MTLTSLWIEQRNQLELENKNKEFQTVELRNLKIIEDY